jgi:hypothetical protein
MLSRATGKLSVEDITDGFPRLLEGRGSAGQDPLSAMLRGPASVREPG